ncbi:hypothetical protein UY3_00583 [Chelonia mydas]|uniref:Uncharacterized protein n=1 Tax=Chelonia mydas TaxID=8469 RepID=M7BWH4_CHEMY|nr:hypothetical protein UY3_00583 [Chelonia mydas]
MIRCCLWTRSIGGAGIYVGHGTAISTQRSGTDGSSCSANGLAGQTRIGKMPAIDARSYGALAETWNGNLSGNGIDDHASTDCGISCETRTVGDIRHSPIDIRFAKMSGAGSPEPDPPKKKINLLLVASDSDNENEHASVHTGFRAKPVINMDDVPWNGG